MGAGEGCEGKAGQGKGDDVQLEVGPWTVSVALDPVHIKWCEI